MSNIEDFNERRRFRGRETVRDEDALAALGDFEPIPALEPPSKTRPGVVFALGIALGTVMGLALEWWWLHGGAP